MPRLCCVSTGNAEGLGPVRQEELTIACGILGASLMWQGLNSSCTLPANPHWCHLQVPVDHVECLDHSELQVREGHQLPGRV